jgi:hypothetical protein
MPIIKRSLTSLRSSRARIRNKVYNESIYTYRSVEEDIQDINSRVQRRNKDEEEELTKTEYS